MVLHRFLQERRGAVAPMFALAIIPIFGLIGMAVDYSRGNAVKTSLQAALDATSLAMARLAPTLTAAQLQTQTTAYFMAQFNRPEAKNVVVTPTYTTSGGSQLTISATGHVDTAFMRVMGYSSLNVGSSSTVKWGNTRLRVALVLDNTGSMANSGKLTQLKAASHNLLTTLQTAAKQPGDVKVAIIPFDTTVNLGTSYKDNIWFDVSCSALGNPQGCNNNNWKNYWEGCVRDRTYPYDTQDDPPTGTNTYFPVYDCGSLTTLMPLSYDWTALNAKVDAMSPNGNTNVTIGLVWAWHALTAQAPLSEAAAPAPDLDKVIILLTDGTNTESWKNSNNTAITSSSAIDLRTALVCTNVKAANIRLYTIRVIDGNASLLQSCATNPSMYFDVQQASQLDSVFTAIAQNLANLRIAK